MRRLSSVLFSYSFREASKIECNFGEKELNAVGVALDMATSTKKGLGSECMMLAVPVAVRAAPDNSLAPSCRM